MKKLYTLFPLLLLSVLVTGCFDSDSSNSTRSSQSSQDSNSYNGEGSNNDNNSNNNNKQNSKTTELYAKVIKKTGQTKSYNGSGQEVTDGSLKDDGFYQKGATPQYQRDDSNNIVEDLATKLLWEDGESVESNDHSYRSAKNYCENLSLGGKSWHIPSIKEFMSIVDYTKRAPALDATFLNAAYGTDDVGYWSSTTRGLGWQMWLNFFSGKIHWYETSPNKHYVRCVSSNNSAWAKANFSTSNTTVTDNNSKLEWQDSYSGTIPQLAWEEAIDYCENLTLGGKSDWRLPNINELFSITEHSHGSPTINESFKNTKEGFYWSSTTYSGSSSYAWVVSFEYGSNTYYPKSRKYSVRCVRSRE